MTSPGPPWSEEFLADFHAGLHDDDPELLRGIYSDPDAVRFLEALEKATDDLRRLGRRRWE